MKSTEHTKSLKNRAKILWRKNQFWIKPLAMIGTVGGAAYFGAKQGSKNGHEIGLISGAIKRMNETGESLVIHDRHGDPQIRLVSLDED